MGKTSIEWTDASWNPIVGCTEISPGCANCYAARLAATRLREVRAYAGLATGTIEKIPEPRRSHRFQRAAIRWTGQLRFLPERLQEPLRIKKPTKFFVCDMGDLFHEGVHDEWLSEIISVILNCPQHTFQILTKRPARMLKWFEYVGYCASRGNAHLKEFPLPNVWLGVSVENQHFADERIPFLLSTPAAVRWISAEPLLGHLDLQSKARGTPSYRLQNDFIKCLDWVVCGGESGPNARPMHPDWVRFLRDQCQAAGVPFFFKQWGEYLPFGQFGGPECHVAQTDAKVGKKKAGRLLDGREWSEFPKVAL